MEPGVEGVTVAPLKMTSPVAKLPSFALSLLSIENAPVTTGAWAQALEESASALTATTANSLDSIEAPIFG